MGGVVSKGAKATRAPSLRDRLSESFLKALEGDFAVHGLDVIVGLRQREPAKYAELAAKLVAQAAQPPDPTDFSSCKSEEDIGRKLLQQLGLSDDQLTEDMLKRACKANDEFVDKLLVISAGN